MDVGKSPEWLPFGFAEKFKYKNGRRIKYYYNVATGAKYHSKKDVLSCATTENSDLRTPQKPTGDDDELFINSEADAVLEKMEDSSEGLPDGWTLEERTRRKGSRKGSVYKVYTDVSAGKRFYSRASMTQYLNTVHHANTLTLETKCDNVDEPSPNMSTQCPSMTNSGGTLGEKKEGNTPEMVDDPSPKCLSMTSAGGPPEENDGNSSKMLDKVDGSSLKCLSMTSTGGPGVLPEENDGNSSMMLDKVDEPSPLTSPRCLCMTNTDSTSKDKKKFKPVSVESSTADDLPPGWIKEVVTSKYGSKIRKDPYYIDPVTCLVFRSKPDALRYVETNDIRSCAIRPKKRESGDLNWVNNKISSSHPAEEILHEHKEHLFVGGESNGLGESCVAKTPSNSEAKTSKQTLSNDESVVVTSAGDKIPNKNPSNDTKIEINPELENKDEPPVVDVNSTIPFTKQTERTHANSKNSRKRKVPNFTPSTSKKRSRSETEPAKEPSETSNIIEQPNEVENPPIKNPIIPEEQINDGGNGSKQESQLCFDFGDSWSDPLEFALKTLRGEIPIDDTLGFGGRFSGNLGIPFNNNQLNGCLEPSRSDIPDIFRNDAAPNSEFPKQQSAVDPFRANSSSFSAFGDMGFPDFSGLNNQRGKDE